MVCLAQWKGRKFALKQVDVGKDGYGANDKELEAYSTLKDAEDVLVPTPLFVSESWTGWIKYLGLQLGRDPTTGDDLSGRNDILASLEHGYGLRHKDADRRNMLCSSLTKKSGPNDSLPWIFSLAH